MGRVMIEVDLQENTVNGKKLMPKVCELTLILVEAGRPMNANEVVAKLYGSKEPVNPFSALRQTARLAKIAGVPIVVSNGRPRGSTKGSHCIGSTYKIGGRFGPR